MTRDQIADVMADVVAGVVAGQQPTPPAAPAEQRVAGGAPLAADETPVLPEVADGVAVRWIDPAAPWIIDAGGDARSTRHEPAVVARVTLRFDDTKADLVHDDEYECVIAPLTDPVDVSRAISVEYDDRDLLAQPPTGATYRLGPIKLANKSTFTTIERDLRDHLVRTLSIDLPANPELDLYGRPGESAEAFSVRCGQVADQRADAEIAALRDKYETKAMRLRDQLAAAEDRVDVLEAQADAKRDSELLSTAGSILGGLLGGRSRGGLLGKLRGAANRRGTTKAAQERVQAAESKTARLHAELEQLEAELAEEIVEIDGRWTARAGQVSTITVPLEKADVDVTHLVLAWLPVS
jgi:hypothetical protein